MSGINLLKETFGKESISFGDTLALIDSEYFWFRWYRDGVRYNEEQPEKIKGVEFDTFL